jgi:hypothetical protein
MVTLHLLEYIKSIPLTSAMQNPGSMAWNFEKLPLDKVGGAIYSVGGEQPRGGRTKSQLFELEIRGPSDTEGYAIAATIAEHFANDWVVCDLPLVTGVSNRLYRRCRIDQVSNVQNVGFDANDRIIYKITARALYQK